ncbi:MAG: PEGA domain-containing protein [Spirochaetaceae bacterium]|jgi:hypothetical protein|nr:PEGA domain-containing protein [Spirochaetaceae bacterium]
MKKFVLSFIFCITGLVLFAQNTLIPSPPSPFDIDEHPKIDKIKGTTGIRVETIPNQAEVYIDGKYRGLSPITVTDIEPGRHSIEVNRDGFRRKRADVGIRLDERVSVSLKLNPIVGFLFIDILRAKGSPPESMLQLDPEIIVDGVAIPYSSPMEVPAGYRNIEIEAFGWQRVKQGIFVPENNFQWMTFEMHPVVFALNNAGLSKPIFNPHNPGNLGKTSLKWTANAPGNMVITVSDKEDQAVYETKMDDFKTANNSLSWNGRDINGNFLPDGSYKVTYTASSIPWDNSAPIQSKMQAEVTLDSSLTSYPRTTSSGISGFLFAPSPDILPPGSFQLDVGVLAGQPFENSKLWADYPISINGRYSLLRNFEFAAAVNIDPMQGEPSNYGVSGGVKWQFIESSGDFFSLALAGNYAMLNNSYTDSYGMDAGVKLSLPLMFRIGKLFIDLSPSILWTGPHGYPEEGVPKMIAAMGIAYQTDYFSVALSARTFFDYTDIQFSNTMAGLELKINPLPSNFLISLYGGAWSNTNWKAPKYFGGLSLGVLY